jgi:protein-S-isoprenylcysteine O-methyltransferase Ste14
MRSLFDTFQLLTLVAFHEHIARTTADMWVRRRVNVFAVGARGKGLRGAVELALVVPLAFWFVETAAYSLGPEYSLVPAVHARLLDSDGARLAGAALEALGLALFAGALVSFGSSWRVGIDERRPGDLVTTGVFAYSRNPIFLFFDLYAVGTFLVHGTAFFLVSAVLIAAGVHMQVLQEERFLAKAYGDAYRRYRERTGRYLTVPWPGRG